MPELVDWIVERLGIGPGASVVDVAAGTGKLTRQLVPTGARLIAVEPLAEMRAQLEAAVPGVEALAGSAERLPLPDASADAITVGSAMHWFDPPPALREFHRVLKPGGGLGALGQGRDLTDPFQQQLQEVLAPYVPDAEGYGVWRRELAASGLFGPLEEREASFEQLFDADGLVERMETISYVADLPEDERAALLERVRAVAEAQPESPFAFRYGAYAAVCRRR